MLTGFSEARFSEAKKYLNIKSDLIFSLKKSDRFSVTRKGDKVEIEYRNGSQALRALTVVKTENGDFTETESPCMDEIGYLIDVARNATPKVETLKKTALKLALLGYTRIYLYLEDEIKVDGEPFLGYLRGAYSKEELKSFDEYCYGLGIECIPCVQTLAHLECIFRWNDYAKIRDKDNVILVGDKRTYQYIDNLLNEVSTTFKTKNIHVGLDEAFSLGQGKYFTEHGYRNRYEIMTEHINTVYGLCRKYGLSMQMWSDMLFSIASGEYSGVCNAEDEEKLKDVMSNLPKDVELVYWNYYYDDYAVYDDALKLHKNAFGNVSFAGAAWKWTGFNPANVLSKRRVDTVVKACKENGVKTAFLTGWGDNGSESSVFSTLPTLAYFAEKVYGSKYTCGETFRTVCGCEENDFLLLDIPSVKFDGNKQTLNLSLLYKNVLYNDPLYGSMDLYLEHFDLKGKLKLIKEEIEKATARQTEYKYLFETASAYAEVLYRKCDISFKIRELYLSGKKSGLSAVADTEIPSLIEAVKDFYEKFRFQWETENRMNGFEVQDARFGGLICRLSNVKRILLRYVNGEISEIEQLKEPRLHIPKDEAIEFGSNLGTWTQIYTVNVP